MNFAAYYKTELSLVQEMARAFAEVYPATAGLLKEKSGDPDVERLIEAFAFQAARIRAKIDQTAPSIVHGLAELMLPHYLRSLPSATIVEFTPNLATLRTRQRIPAGKMLQARPVEGTQCKFRTCFDVDLLPLEIADAVLDDRVSARPKLRLHLRCTEAGKTTLAELERLRLYVHHGEPSFPALMMQWFMRHCTGVTLRAPADDRELGRIDPRGLRMAGADPAAAVFPWPTSAAQGYRLVLEYFAIPEKFLFLDVAGIDACKLEVTEFVLCFEFERPPPLPVAIGKGSFRLHCTPAVNLFDVVAQPVPHSPLVQEHLLRADGVPAKHMEVQEVRSVTGGGRERRKFAPFYRFTHVASGAPSYALRRTHGIDDGVDTYLSIIEPEDLPATEETLSIELTCTNRFLPRELNTGDIQESPPGALFKSYTNITPVSPPVRVPLGAEAQWRLLSHLALNQRGLTSAEMLRALLGLYNLFGKQHARIGRRNERQIEAIRKVEQEAVTRMVRGVPIRAVRTRIELDEAAVPLGNAYVFGTVLHELYGSLVHLNSASEVQVELHPSKTELKWPVKIGV